MVFASVLLLLPSLTFFMVIVDSVLATPFSPAVQPDDLHALSNIRRCGEKIDEVLKASMIGKGSPLEPPQLNLTYRADKGLQKSSWPKAYGNPENTGQSIFIGDNTGNLLWKYRVNQPSYLPKTQFYASPIIDSEGNILIGLLKRLFPCALILCFLVLDI